MKTGKCYKHTDCVVEYEKLSCPVCEMEAQLKNTQELQQTIDDQDSEITQLEAQISYLENPDTFEIGFGRPSIDTL